jgi:hypothetical protein
LWTWSRNNARPSAPPTRSAAQSRSAWGYQAIRARPGRRGPRRNGSPHRRSWNRVLCSSTPSQGCLAHPWSWAIGLSTREALTQERPRRSGGPRSHSAGAEARSRDPRASPTVATILASRAAKATSDFEPDQSHAQQLGPRKRHPSEPASVFTSVRGGFKLFQHDPFRKFKFDAEPSREVKDRLSEAGFYTSQPRRHGQHRRVGRSARPRTSWRSSLTAKTSATGRPLRARRMSGKRLD